MKDFFYSLWEIFEVVAVAIIVVLFVRTFLIQPFLVSGASMEPNFSSGDYLLIDKISYRFREPQRGEVVVFHSPDNERIFYIKRIIGLLGEQLVFKNGLITVFNNEHPNGFTLQENYLPPGLKILENKKIILEKNEYFVLGDNRNYSYDSRIWGNLSKTEIIGLVRLRLWPLNEIMAVGKPAY